jgi:multiple sugar transport system substrate-binding protein
MARKSLLIVLIVAALATLALAAGGAARTASPNAVTLTMWVMPNSPQPAADLKQVVGRFEANTGISVNVENVGWDVQYSKIQNAAISGRGPDITQAGTTQVPYFASLGGFTNLASKVSQIGGRKAYPPAAWQTTRIAGRSGVYAVPWFTEARAIFYRTDVFKKRHINPKTAFKTWASFHRTLKKINNTRIGGRTLKAIGFPGKNTWDVAHNMFPWIWGAGGDELTKSLRQSAVNTPQALRGVMFYTSLVPQGLAYKPALEKNATQVDTMFKQGLFSIVVTGPWMVASSTDPQGGWNRVAARHYAISPVPKGPKGRYTFLGGSNLMVFKASDHQNEAWQLVRYLSQTNAQLGYAKVSGMLPARANAQRNKAFMVKAPAKYQAFVQAVKYGRSYPSIPKWGSVEGAYVKHFGNIWDMAAGAGGRYTKSSVRSELRSASGEVNNLLRQG